jgi:hypothetical protein
MEAFQLFALKPGERSGVSRQRTIAYRVFDNVGLVRQLSTGSEGAVFSYPLQCEEGRARSRWDAFPKGNKLATGSLASALKYAQRELQRSRVVELVGAPWGENFVIHSFDASQQPDSAEWDDKYVVCEELVSNECAIARAKTELELNRIVRLEPRGQSTKITVEKMPELSRNEIRWGRYRHSR